MRFRFEQFEKDLRELCLKSVEEDDGSAKEALELWEGFGAISEVEEERAFRMRNLMMEMGLLPPVSTYLKEADDIVRGKERDG